MLFDVFTALEAETGPIQPETSDLRRFAYLGALTVTRAGRSTRSEIR